MLRGKLPFSAETHDGTLELLANIARHLSELVFAVNFSVETGSAAIPRKTVKCDVSYSAKPFAEVSQGIIDLMKATLRSIEKSETI